MNTQQIIAELHTVLQGLNSVEVRRYENAKCLTYCIERLEALKAGLVESLTAPDDKEGQ